MPEEILKVQREVENEHDLGAVCLLISRRFSVLVSDVLFSYMYRSICAYLQGTKPGKKHALMK